MVSRNWIARNQTRYRPQQGRPCVDRSGEASMQRSGFAAFPAALRSDWTALARSEQLPPPGDWIVWLLLAGRGFGKTRAGAEWCRMKVAQGCRRLAICGATAGDVRDTMVLSTT